ncbi:MAG: hypothetical protein WDA65_06545 [Christensenellales bacterium]
MKKILLAVLGLIILFNTAACAGAPSETEQTNTTETVSAAPEPTPEPTPTPEPVPVSVQRFSADPRKFIVEAICSQQVEMAILLYAEDSSSFFDTSSPDLIHGFIYENYNEGYDEASGQTIISYESACYDISLLFADPVYSDNFNYKYLAADIGMILNLEYSDHTITTYSSDGSKKKIVQKWAQGSEDSYSTSWLYIDSSYTDEGTARLTYGYPMRNEVFDTLAADSFKMASLPFVSALASFEQTDYVGYSPKRNYVSAETGPALGKVGMIWWNVTEDGIFQLVDSLSSNPNASVATENDFFHSYLITVESDYFDSIALEYYAYDADVSAEPNYKVNCYIYYK